VGEPTADNAESLRQQWIEATSTNVSNHANPYTFKGSKHWDRGIEKHLILLHKKTFTMYVCDAFSVDLYLTNDLCIAFP